MSPEAHLRSLCLAATPADGHVNRHMQVSVPLEQLTEVLDRLAVIDGRGAADDGKPGEPEINFALRNLRHLYEQMLAGHVKDAASAARGLLGPAIEKVERAVPLLDRLASAEGELARLKKSNDALAHLAVADHRARMDRLGQLMAVEQQLAAVTAERDRLIRKPDEATEAVTLARTVIGKYGADADKPSVHLATALLAGAHERDRLRAQLQDVTAARDELAEIAIEWICEAGDSLPESTAADRNRVEHLRSAGKDSAK